MEMVKCATCRENFNYLTKENGYPSIEQVKTLKTHFCCNSCYKFCSDCCKQKTHFMTCSLCKAIGFHLH